MWLFAVCPDPLNLLSVMNSTLTKILLKTCTHVPTSNRLKSYQTRSLSHHHLSLSWTEVYPGSGASLIDYTAEPLEPSAQGCLETNLQTNRYYRFAPHDKYKYIQCGIKKEGIKTYSDNMLKKENTTLHLRRFKNGNGVQILMASMPDDQALGEWELHTLEDMRWNDKHQCPMKYCSWHIIRSMIWLMWHPAYAEHIINPPQRCFISYKTLKRVNTKMHTVDWPWETHIRRYTAGY